MAFRLAFQNYHKKHADLKMLCIDCHKIKTKTFMSKPK